jgi:quercetin dioxygenase-like cupin family protein
MPGQVSSNAVWFLDNRVEFRSPEASEYALLELSGHPGDVVPLHRHREDEVFTVLSGELTIVIGSETLVVEAGRSVSAPRNVPHAYRVSSATPARWLVLTTPGEFAAFVTTMARPAETDGLPTPGGPPSDEQAAHLASVAADFGIEILGPPPFAAHAAAA